MPRTPSMASHTPLSDCTSKTPDQIPLPLSSDSSMEGSHSPRLKKRPITSKRENPKKSQPDFSKTLTPEESHLFWGIEQKRKYESLSTHSIVPGRALNLDQLEQLHCRVRKFFKAQKLVLLFQLLGVEYYEEPVRFFYANLHFSKDSGELETLVLGRRIIINDTLFAGIFCTNFDGVIPYMNGTWPKNFEISLEKAKTFISEEGTDISNFGPHSLCFENHVLAHIIATTLLPRKGSLSGLSTRDIFVLYCMLKKYNINWASRFREYMVESAQDSQVSASLPYGLLISRILLDCVLDLKPYKSVVILATYDSRTFSSMGYTLINGEWCKKDDGKGKQEAPKMTKVTVDSAIMLMKEAEDIKPRLEAMEKGMATMQESLDKVLQLSKESSRDLSKLRLGLDGLKKNGLSW